MSGSSTVVSGAGVLLARAPRQELVSKAGLDCCLRADPGCRGLVVLCSPQLCMSVGDQRWRWASHGELGAGGVEAGIVPATCCDLCSGSGARTGVLSRPG